MDALYKAHSIIATSFREKPIRVEWVFFMRANPLKHYNELVSEYDYLEDDDLDWVKERVDGFLCKEEIDWLEEFLDKKFGVKLEVEKISGVKSAKVEITFEPPWNKNMMSEEAKLELGFL